MDFVLDQDQIQSSQKTALGQARINTAYLTLPFGIILNTRCATSLAMPKINRISMK